MTSVAGDYCDYNMGDYNCSEGFYGYEVEGDYGGYENGHGENIGRFENYYCEGENEVNEVPSAYGDFGDDVVPRDGSYDEVGTCEESCTLHSEPRFGVRYNPFICKPYGSYDESTREECEDSYSPPCSTSYQGRYGVNGYTRYSVGCPMGRRGSTSPKSRGTHVPYNVDPRRSVHSGKVTICGIPGCLVVLDDKYYGNYIVPSMVDYLGLFCEPLLVPYFLDRFKVTERVKVVFSQFNYHEEVWCDVFPITYGHVSLGADWFAQHKVPNVQNWPNMIRDRWGNLLETCILPGPQKEVPTYSYPNYYERQKIERSKGVKGGNPRVEKGEVVWSEVRGLPPNQANVVCPSISKDTCVGSNMESEEEPCQKKVAAQTFGGPSHHDKEESTQGLQGNMANSYTFVRLNDNCEASSPLSVSCSLPIDGSIFSFPLNDDVSVVSVDTLVDPIDDRIKFSCKIDLCPPSVETIMLNESTLSSEICVDQLMCESYPPLEDVYDVTNEPQVCDDVENVDQGEYEPESSSWGNIVFEESLKLDIDRLASEELVGSKSVREVNHTLFRYNVLFEDDLNTSNEPSGENNGIACLGSYSLYANPLWCDNISPQDGNLFSEDESTLKGRECVVLKGDSHSGEDDHDLLDYLGNPRYDYSCKNIFVNDSFAAHGDLYLCGDYSLEIKGGACLEIPSTSSLCVSYIEHTSGDGLEASEYMHKDTLAEASLCDTFLYPPCAHDISTNGLGGMPNLEDDTLGKSELGRNPCPWLLLPFDPGSILGHGRSCLGPCSLFIDVHHSHFLCDMCTKLFTINPKDSWLYCKYVQPWHDDVIC